MKKVGCKSDQIRIRGKCVTLLKGKSYGMKPSQFNQKQLKIGTKVEMEHTTLRNVSQRIAMDHLVEDPDYYKKLKKIHKD